jgi:GntR family carbon starvation induced transcriptional regulator
MQRPLRSEGDPNEYNTAWNLAHDEFHTALAAACANRTLLLVREQLFAKSARYRWLSVSATSKARNLDAEHRALAEAALDRDGDRAAVLLTIHIKKTARILANAMGSTPEFRAEARLLAG